MITTLVSTDSGLKNCVSTSVMSAGPPNPLKPRTTPATSAAAPVIAIMRGSSRVRSGSTGQTPDRRQRRYPTRAQSRRPSTIAMAKSSMPSATSLKPANSGLLRTPRR